MPVFLAALETQAERNTMADLYEQHSDRLLRVALSITGHQAMAEDAVHNTFVAAIRYKEKLLSQDTVNFLRWSVIVVKAKSIDLLRRERRYAEEPFDEALAYQPADDPAVEDLVIRTDMRVKLLGSIAGLDGVSRTLVEMKYILDMSYKEISDETGFSHSQINDRLTRARAKIRKQMGSGVNHDGEW